MPAAASRSIIEAVIERTPSWQAAARLAWGEGRDDGTELENGDRDERLVA
jgi:hypothetical protein